MNITLVVNQTQTYGMSRNYLGHLKVSPGSILALESRVRNLQTLWKLVPCVQYGNVTDTNANMFSMFSTPLATRLTQGIVFQVYKFCEFEAFVGPRPFLLLETFKILLVVLVGTSIGTISFSKVYGGISSSSFSCLVCGS